MDKSPETASRAAPAGMTASTVTKKPVAIDIPVDDLRVNSGGKVPKRLEKVWAVGMCGCLHRAGSTETERELEEAIQ